MYKAETTKILRFYTNINIFHTNQGLSRIYVTKNRSLVPILYRKQAGVQNCR